MVAAAGLKTLETAAEDARAGRRVALRPGRKRQRERGSGHAAKKAFRKQKDPMASNGASRLIQLGARSVQCPKSSSASRRKDSVAQGS